MPALTIPCGAEQAVTERLIRLIGKNKFKLWFSRARFELRSESLQVVVPNRFAADWIDSHFHDALLGVAERMVGPGAAVQLSVDSTLQPLPSAAPAEPVAVPASRGHEPEKMPASSASSPQGLRHRLDEFIVGPGNELAYTAALRLCETDRPQSGLLFVHGGCGLGKTHLLQGLCRRFAAEHPQARWAYWSAEQFANRYIQAVRNNRLAEFRKQLRQLDLLAVDDIHFLATKAATQKEFLHTFDMFDLQGSRLAVASDTHPKWIDQLSEALRSRFLGGMVVELEKPDSATLSRIILGMAQRRGLDLQPDAADALAQRCDHSIREAEGLLTKVSALSHLGTTPMPAGGILNAAKLAQMLRDPVVPVPVRPVRFEQIMQAVSRRLGLERQQVLSRSRHRRIVLARSLVIHLARQLTPMSYPELTRALGRPNHSTIITAAKRIGEQIAGRHTVPLLDAEPGLTVDQLAEQVRRQILRETQRAA